MFFNFASRLIVCGKNNGFRKMCWGFLPTDGGAVYETHT